MNSPADCYRLHNGIEIPCIGFGTYQMPNDALGVSAVKQAIQAGYRHIDTAAGYNNEESVGIAVRESEVPRADLFITTKLQNDMHGYSNTMVAFEQSMKNLNMEYLDLYLIHWPNPITIRDNWKAANEGTWKAFEELYQAGRIRSIGISNFHAHHIDALCETATVLPMVNQIRLCPGDTQSDLVEYCRKRQIILQAYSPLGSGQIFDVPEMKNIADTYGKSVAQVCIRWSLQMGFLPLPKTVNNERIVENADVFGFELSDADMKNIAGLSGCCGYSLHPDEVEF